VSGVARRQPRFAAAWQGAPADTGTGFVIAALDPAGRGSRSTIGMVAPSGPPPTPRPPGRVLLRVAGVATQLGCGACLLVGTIGLVLVEQNQTGGLSAVAAWLLAAMAGLVVGGLIYRGGLVAMLIAAAIDGGFGAVLATFDHATLGRLLKILRPSDVAAIQGALTVAGFAMIGAGVLCLVAVPHGIRYARWFREAAVGRSVVTTPGFPPPPVPARSTVYIIPAEDQPVWRRRVYVALGAGAIVVGIGAGALVSSTGGVTLPGDRHGSATAAAAGSGSTRAATRTGAAANAASGTAASTAAAATDSHPAGAISTGAAEPRTPTATPPDTASSAAPPGDPGREITVAPVGTVQDLVLAQHAAIAAADRTALAAVLSTTAFAFGVDAAEVADGRDAVSAQVVHDLGDPPSGGFTVDSRAIAIGEDRGHAWIAELIDISAPGRAPRSVAISELAATIDGRWQIVALHWGVPVDDATAERLAILSRLPVPARLVDRHDDADLDQAVRAAFASRTAFAEARSERADAFNFGSGGERAHGGAVIKRIFSKLRAEIRIHDGVRVASGATWDQAQKAAPWIGWAALNVDYTARTRAATDVTQTFRVLAILRKEADGWKIIQTQWSNAGPVR
jgi:ketosteroid isomerase-like protein